MTSAPSASERRLVVATLNRAKGRELVRLLADLPFEITLLADLPRAQLPDETGATYTENALIKARAAVQVTRLSAVGDDSGLEVDALGGEPGLRSARFGGPGLDDVGRTTLLLERLRDVPDERRTARFVCVIALVDETGRERVVQASVEGRITHEARGHGGFGYDPVFFYPPLARTFAELSADEKSNVDHRGGAVRALKRLLYS